MSMKLPKQQYKIVTKRKPFPSVADKTYNEPTYAVHFKGLTDGKEYLTYILKSMKNYKQWESIMDAVIDTVVTFEPGFLKGSNIIDADSVPHIIGAPPTPPKNNPPKNNPPAPQNSNFNDVFGD
jgi:hypothetical protein